MPANQPVESLSTQSTQPIKPTQPAAYLLLFIENTAQLVLYKGERDGAPDVCTLLGGKIGEEAPGTPADENTDPAIRQMEYDRPWIGMLREVGEEAGRDFRPQNICYAFDFISPYKEDQAMQIHVHTATISADDFVYLQPPSGKGQFVTFDIDTLNDDPLDNTLAISPMNNAVIQTYKDHGITGKTYMSPKDFYEPIRSFQKHYSLKSGLKAA